MIHLVTPTDGRPEAFSLLEEWVAAQDYPESFRWIVATGDPGPYDFRMNQLILHRTARTARTAQGMHPLCANLGVALDSLASSLSDDDAILVVEDDDYYAPGYLAAMAEALGRSPLVGSPHARYYNVATNRHRTMSNAGHASLAQTGFTPAVLGHVRAACRKGQPFVDRAVWGAWTGPTEMLADPSLHVSLKGMPGIRGIGTGHREDFGTLDRDLSVFRGWGIPDVYLKYGRPAPPPATDGATPASADGAAHTSHPAVSPLVAPLNTAGFNPRCAGRIGRKPWDYPVTAVIPHLNTPEPLEWSIRTILAQTIPAYVLVVDTGSDAATVERLEALRTDNVEVHYLRSHAWRHPSEPVCAAMDAAFGLCKTEYLYCTHADCFIMRRDWVEWLAGRCSADNPVVGYQMSSRKWVTDEWRWMVSHTNTLLHMPTMLAKGISWSMERHRHQFPGHTRAGLGWPDTETGFNWLLREAGITPEIVGPECNFCRDTDGNRDHVRSYPSAKLYSSPDPRHRDAKDRWMAEAIAGARERVERWALEAAGVVRPKPTPEPEPEPRPIEPVAEPVAPKPGLLAKALNYAASTARHVAAGMPEAPPDVVAARLAACASCVQLDAADRSCRVCGCPVDDKALRAREECPLKKWGASGPAQGPAARPPARPAPASAGGPR